MREDLIEELIKAGSEAGVVATKKNLLDPEWLGRKIDYDFIRDISEIKDVDMSGEGGEYHTLVVSGPIFGKRINIVKSEKITRDQHCFLDMLECELQ
jgi:diphthamide synthase (EF-2-diphthine--ammonia ligase)